MMAFMTWVMFQVLSFVAFMVWYWKKHPSDAMKMMMKWRSFLMK